MGEEVDWEVKSKIEQTKILVVVYGFLITFATALLAASTWLPTMSGSVRIIAYDFAVFMSVSVIWLGYEVAVLFRNIGIRILAISSTFMISLACSVGYLFLIGTLVGSSIRIPYSVFSIPIETFGIVIYFIGLFILAMIIGRDFSMSKIYTPDIAEHIPDVVEKRTLFTTVEMKSGDFSTTIYTLKLCFIRMFSICFHLIVTNTHNVTKKRVFHIQFRRRKKREVENHIHK
ncbi:MAG: hypothetical protein ACW98Y_09485 [Candidatus Thorarchaeota archaeon]